MIAERWVRLLTGIDEEIRRAMHAAWRDGVHAIYERIEAEARGTKQADREVSVQQTQTVPESVTDPKGGGLQFFHHANTNFVFFTPCAILTPLTHNMLACGPVVAHSLRANVGVKRATRIPRSANHREAAGRCNTTPRRLAGSRRPSRTPPHGGTVRV